ncbi:DUF3667 domain-containing protein [Hymenobacter sediminicola]|uniref:DUF3667 domain-containing protein n=1 Tax=Hymenobacter sediminicola TaxID=2761579 RepID=A0A7G7WAU8_9BACT|nr:DUF3667 domain-containing protein [Hymenobacter sediminicola]QNH63491.1 DUF3667 domain-containing protein [Hymenobacter sediminicola]
MEATSTPLVALAPELADSAHAAPGHASDHSPAACLNCGMLVSDRYCGQCGQDAHHTHRFTMRYLLLHDLPHSIWHVDKGVLYTMRQMLTRPGYAIREYLAGQRAQHFRPVTYLLLLGGLGALLMSALHLQPIPPEQVADTPKVLVLAMDRYMATIYKYPTLIYTVLLPLNALVAWLLLRATRYNYAEMLIGQAFVTGTLTLPAVVLTIPLLLLAKEVPEARSLSLLTLVPSVVYPIWVYWQMQAHTRLSATSRSLRAVGASLLQLLVLILACSAYITFLVVSLLRQDPSLRQDLQAKMKPKTASTQAAPARP